MNWKFVKTQYGAHVKAPKFKIQLHWSGMATSKEIDTVLLLIAAAPEMRRVLKKFCSSAQNPHVSRKGKLRHLSVVDWHRAQAALDMATYREIGP